MRYRPIVFSDVDGTICFHQEINGISVSRQRENGLYEVSDPRSGSTYLAHDVSTSSYSIYFAEATRQRLRRLSETYDIVLVTGGRPSTCQKRAPVFDFAKAVIAENGAVIFDKDFRRDEQWWDQLAPQRTLLQDVREYIRSYDWKTDDEGRSSAIRVRLKDNPHKDKEKFARLHERVRLPDGLKSTINLGNLDIVPSMAGKDHAVAFLRDQWGVDPSDTVGWGDDINDMPFLGICGKSYVLASSYPAVLEEAKRHAWNVTRSHTFDGIHEVIDELMDQGYS